MRVESARPSGGRHWDTKVAENGASVTADSGSVRAPSTRSSNEEISRVSRTNRPWAEPADMSPALPLMTKVDSSTRVTTPALASSWVTGPAKFHGSAMGLTVPADLVTCGILGPGSRVAAIIPIPVGENPD
jgi:hypothetical protein